MKSVRNVVAKYLLATLKNLLSHIGLHSSWKFSSDFFFLFLTQRNFRNKSSQKPPDFSFEWYALKNVTIISMQITISTEKKNLS